MTGASRRQRIQALFFASIMVVSMVAAGVGGLAGSAVADLTGVDGIEAEDVTSGDAVSQTVTLKNITANSSGIPRQEVRLSIEKNADVSIENASIQDYGQLNQTDTDLYSEQDSDAKLGVVLDSESDVKTDIILDVTLNTSGASGSAEYNVTTFGTDFVGPSTSFNISDDSTGDIIVNADDGEGDFNSIQAAVNNATSGATITVQKGIYNEQVIISEASNLIIDGSGASTEIQSPSGEDIEPIATGSLNRTVRAPLSIVESSDIKVTGMEIDGQNQATGGKAFFGTYSQNSSVTLSNLSVVNTTQNSDGSPSGNQYNDAIRVSTTDNVDRSLKISNVVVKKFDKNGITVQNSGSGDLSVDITDSMVIGAGPTDATAQNGISLTDVSATITDNTVVNLSYTGPDSASSGYISTNNIFDSKFTGNTLQDGAPSKGAPVGIYLTSSDEVTFTDNTIKGTAFGAFPNDGASGTKIDGNTFTNQDAAILLFNSSNESIYNNIFENNTRHLRDFDGEANLQELVSNNKFDKIAYIEDGQNFLYSSIDDALNGDLLDGGGSSQGDTILAGPGTYNENVNFGTSNVSITGQGQEATIINGRIDIPVDGVTVRNLTVRNGAPSSSNEPEGIFVGNSSGFSNLEEEIEIRDVTVEDVHAHKTDTTVEGIHVKYYESGDPISGINIENVTVQNVTQTAAGANGVKLQAEVNDVSVTNSTFENIEGSWAYGVVATPSNLEMGVPDNVLVTQTTISNVSAVDYSGVGVGIDGSEENGFANASEVDVTRTSFFKNGVDILNKEPDGNSMSALLNYFDEGPSIMGDVAYDPVLTTPVENVDGESVSEIGEYGSVLELNNGGGDRTLAVGFSAPPDANASEIFNDLGIAEGNAYTYGSGGYNQVAGSFTPNTGDVIIFTTAEAIDRDVVVPIDTSVEGAAASPESVEVQNGWNLVATGSVDGIDGIPAALNGGSVQDVTQLQAQPQQPGLAGDPAAFGAFDATWVFVNGDGEIVTGYGENQGPNLYSSEILYPDGQSPEAADIPDQTDESDGQDDS